MDLLFKKGCCINCGCPALDPGYTVSADVDHNQAKPSSSCLNGSSGKSRDPEK